MKIKNKDDFKKLKFKSMKDEIKFWDNIDVGKYFDDSDFEHVSFPNLKYSTRSISIRLPETLINTIKEEANAMDIPYQSLIKQTLYKNFLAA